MKSFKQYISDQKQISKIDLKDAFEVFKDWSYQYKVFWDSHNMSSIWNKLSQKAYYSTIDVGLLQTHYDWKRRPSEEQLQNPIIVGKFGSEEKYVIFDGQHRVIVAKEKNILKLPAYIIPLPLKWSKMTGSYRQSEDI
jgi:hypothetical protein